MRLLSVAFSVEERRPTGFCIFKLNEANLGQMIIISKAIVRTSGMTVSMISTKSSNKTGKRSYRKSSE